MLEVTKQCQKCWSVGVGDVCSIDSTRIFPYLSYSNVRGCMEKDTEMQLVSDTSNRLFGSQSSFH